MEDNQAQPGPSRTPDRQPPEVTPGSLYDPRGHGKDAYNIGYHDDSLEGHDLQHPGVSNNPAYLDDSPGKEGFNPGYRGHSPLHRPDLPYGTPYDKVERP